MARWMGVGRSVDPDSRASGAEAVRSALTGPDPKLLLVFAGIEHDLVAVQEGIADVIEGVPLLGCTTHGEIGPGGPLDGSVTVAALGGSGLSVGTALVEHVAGRQREAGAEVAARAAGRAESPYQVMLVLTDGLIRDQEAILRGCYSVLGASVPLFGGAAGDGWRMAGTHVLCDGKVYADAVVAAMITSDAPMAVAVRHGWRPVGDAMLVTSGANGRVHTLNDQPAMDVYLDRLGAPPEAYRDPAAFVDFALSRPLGVQRRSGVRAHNLSTEVDVDGRSIGGGSAIDQGNLTWIMEGNRESILDAVDHACADARAGLGGMPPIGLLTFSCAATRAVIGDDGIRQEGTRLERAAGGIPFAGFYTYGEIARVGGIDGFHNQTLVVLALA
jgi:hypothetical protein